MKQYNYEYAIDHAAKIRNPKDLESAISRILSSEPNNKPALIFHEYGALGEMKKFMDKLEIDYIDAGPNYDLSGHIYRKEIPFYTAKEDANRDETSGIIFFDKYNITSPAIKSLVDNFMSDSPRFFLGKNWRVAILVNEIEGEEFWKPEYLTKFNVYNYAFSLGVYNSDDNDYDDDEEYESKREEKGSSLNEEEAKAAKKFIRKAFVNGKIKKEAYSVLESYLNNVSEGYFEETKFHSIGEAKEKIYTILYNAIKRNAIEPDEFIILTKDSVVIGKQDEFDSDMINYAKPITELIDFEGLKNGEIIIYRTPLYEFIEKRFA